MTLVIMAAGMGSRFGGLKQLEPVDSMGHILIDYSIYDAIGTGFDRLVLVVKRENEELFKEIIDKRISKWKIKVDIAYQEKDDLPYGFSCPAERIKPWGTGHAVCTLSGVVNEPFCLINADDYYGPSAFREMYSFLSHVGDDELCMVAYRLKNTLSENGGVSRGVCRVCDGFLTDIEETTGIRLTDEGIFGDCGELPLDTLVSMNLWGLTPKIIDECKNEFVKFLRGKSEKELNVCEFYLPNVISELIKAGKYRVRVIESNEKWQGITYKEDLEQFKQAIINMKQSEMYPKHLY